MAPPSGRCGPLLSLLTWTVLTASTVGPGTVTVCSKAGADFGSQLFWTVIVAAFIAWVLQEGAARLTITSGLTLAETVRRRTLVGRGVIARLLFAVFVVLGNFAYECNNFAGTMAAVELVLLPPNPRNLSNTNCSAVQSSAVLSFDGGPSGALAIRQAVNVSLGVVATALALQSARALSLLLSTVVGLMIVCFAATLFGLGLPSGLLSGLVPSLPTGSSELVLALIGTTAIPINLLLGSSLARDSSVGSMRRGVGMASALSGLISMLVQLVGSYVPPRSPCVPFALADLAEVLEGVLGAAGRVGFVTGLFGAGLSSALTIPMGTCLVLEDLFDLRPPPPLELRPPRTLPVEMCAGSGSGRRCGEMGSRSGDGISERRGGERRAAAEDEPRGAEMRSRWDEMGSRGMEMGSRGAEMASGRAVACDEPRGAPSSETGIESHSSASAATNASGKAGSADTHEVTSRADASRADASHADSAEEMASRGQGLHACTCIHVLAYMCMYFCIHVRTCMQRRDGLERSGPMAVALGLHTYMRTYIYAYRS